MKCIEKIELKSVFGVLGRYRIWNWNVVLSEIPIPREIAEEYYWKCADNLQNEEQLAKH